jgi:hypothetical protein
MEFIGEFSGIHAPAACEEFLTVESIVADRTNGLIFRPVCDFSFRHNLVLILQNHLRRGQIPVMGEGEVGPGRTGPLHGGCGTTLQYQNRLSVPVVLHPDILEYKTGKTGTDGLGEGFLRSEAAARDLGASAPRDRTSAISAG